MENGTFAEALAPDQELIVQALGRTQALGGLTEDQLQDIKGKLQHALNFPEDAQIKLDFDPIQGRGIFMNYGDDYIAPDGKRGCSEIRGQLEIGSKRVQFIYRIETGELKINDVSVTRQQVSEQVRECLEKTHIIDFYEGVTNDGTKIKIQHIKYKNLASGAVLNLHVLITINDQPAQITRTDKRANIRGSSDVYSVRVLDQNYVVEISPRGNCKFRKNVSHDEITRREELLPAESSALYRQDEENAKIAFCIFRPDEPQIITDTGKV